MFGLFDGQVAPLTSMLGAAGVIEVVAGGLIVIGLFTRPAAFVASGTMAVAYWMAHAPQGAFPIGNGGEAAILYCFVFLYLVFAGPGAWSLDDVRRRAPTDTVH
jgi:putative oxidoreductase